VLHYTDRDRVPPAGGARSFLIDAGASHAGYACDITRTHVRDTGHEFQSLVEAVDAAERRLCDRVRSGVDYRDIHLEAHLAMARILRDFGILRIEPETAVETGVSGAFFPHGIGHLIGLQVHDVGGLAESDRGGAIPRPEGHPYLRLTRTLAPGMVVTIEPGIYFIDLLLDELRGKDAGAGVDWERVARFRPFGGVRIEDDVACTDAAPENLSRDAFAAAG
jgi:Xaa-Pro dipeptidase